MESSTIFKSKDILRPKSLRTTAVSKSSISVIRLKDNFGFWNSNKYLTPKAHYIHSTKIHLMPIMYVPNIMPVYCSILAIIHHCSFPVYKINEGKRCVHMIKLWHISLYSNTQVDCYNYCDYFAILCSVKKLHLTVITSCQLLPVNCWGKVLKYATVVEDFNSTPQFYQC